MILGESLVVLRATTCQKQGESYVDCVADQLPAALILINNKGKEWN
jgi:hypothetical protein